MKYEKHINLIGLAVLLPILVVFAAIYLWADSDDYGGVVNAISWQAAVSPGPLSDAHAFLENDCNSCHTPVTGVSVNSCILCHANNESILQRQPTAFHADIRSCSECHIEHQGRSHSPTAMNHEALTKIGLRELGDNLDSNSDDRLALRELHEILGKGSVDSLLVNSSLSVYEMALDCASCHQNDDQHFELFGQDCASCHAATAWTIPEFRHPAASSMDCAQCHQAPPSHYMMHFNMISQKVAAQPTATVEKCYMCHQTTSWPDIKGAGWYKHH